MRVLRTCVVSAAVASLVCLSGLAAQQPARPSERQTLLGVWELVSLQDHHRTGMCWTGWARSRRAPLSTAPTVTCQCKSCATHIQWLPRPCGAVTDATCCRAHPPARSGDAYGGYYAYFGTWEIDEGARTVTHHIRGSMRAEEVGADYVRPCEFSSEYLLLRSTVSPASGEKQIRVITWRRAGRF